MLEEHTNDNRDCYHGSRQGQLPTSDAVLPSRSRSDARPEDLG
jgi:hypothetical protein